MKLKSKIKDEKLIVKAKKSVNEEISFREADTLSRINARGFLRPKKTTAKKIEYIGPSGISLSARLKSPMRKQEFYNYMAQIISIVNKVKSNNLFLNNLVLDFRYVFVNEKTQEMLFIYTPLVGNHIIVDVLGFMEGIAYSTVVSPDERENYTIKFQQFLKNLNTFDADAIYNYIIHQVPSIKSNNVSGFMTDKPKDYYDHYGNNNFDDEKTSILEDDDEPTGLLNEDDATGLLEEENSEETALLVENNVPNYPTLYRVLTNEKISINKPVFRIGKEKSYVDYFVSNNNTISRSHADIITRNNRYFIMDLNSKNHTYIDERMIPVKCEVEMYNGCKIRLSNEEFVFEI